jgi:hypothetical protein
MAHSSISSLIEKILEIALFSVMGIGVTTVIAHSLASHYPQDGGNNAAWFQGVGTMIAIVGAFVIGERQSRASLQAIADAQMLAERSRRNSIFAVAKAAYARSKHIESAFSGSDIVSTLFRTYDQSIIDSIVGALSASPVHELGSDDAVISFLGLRDHFVFLGKAIERYVEDATELLDADTAGPQEEQSFIVKAAHQTNKDRLDSVRQQLGEIDRHFSTLTKAIHGARSTK